MHFIDTAGNVDGQFVAGNPENGTPPTIFGADWPNMLQNELGHVLEQAEIYPDKADNTQLYQALMKIIDNNVGNSSYSAITPTNLNVHDVSLEDGLNEFYLWGVKPESGFTNPHSASGTTLPLLYWLALDSNGDAILGDYYRNFHRYDNSDGFIWTVDGYEDYAPITSERNVKPEHGYYEPIRVIKRADGQLEVHPEFVGLPRNYAGGYGGGTEVTYSPKNTEADKIRLFFSTHENWSSDSKFTKSKLLVREGV